jgi:hypothetical protein
MDAPAYLQISHEGALLAKKPMSKVTFASSKSGKGASKHCFVKKLFDHLGVSKKARLIQRFHGNGQHMPCFVDQQQA